MIHTVFHSEVYRKITYTIDYNEQVGYTTTISLINEKREKNFAFWGNAVRWARDVIDENVRGIVPFNK